MSGYKKIQRALSQPFPQEDLEWRVQSAGETNGRFWARIIAYVTNRAIQQRLDDTVGINGWRNEFLPLPNSVGNGAMCGISIKFGDEWVTKYDGADNTHVEATKGGLSASMKRAAVQFGIGRYLYDIEAHYATCISVEAWKRLQQNERDQYERTQTKDKKVFYWKPPELDARFLPKKHIGKPTYETIKKLIAETDTNEAEVCEKFGIDDLMDLYTDEAGELTTLLLRKKQKMEGKNDSTDSTASRKS